jgi:hypothetical protein
LTNFSTSRLGQLTFYQKKKKKRGRCGKKEGGKRKGRGKKRETEENLLEEDSDEEFGKKSYFSTKVHPGQGRRNATIKITENNVTT